MMNEFAAAGQQFSTATTAWGWPQYLYHALKTDEAVVEVEATLFEHYRDRHTAEFPRQFGMVIGVVLELLPLDAAMAAWTKYTKGPIGTHGDFIAAVYPHVVTRIMAAAVRLPRKPSEAGY